MRRATVTLRAFKFELALLGLIALTSAALLWEDELLTRSTTFDAKSASRFVAYGYGDEGMGGRSRASIDPRRPLTWTCDLRQAYQYPMCGYEILLDPPLNTKGRDFSKVENVHLTYRYDGAAEMLRMHVKNYNPIYSSPGRGETSKFNRVDIPIKRGRQSVTVALADFGVAEWWLTQNRIPPELSQPEFDNVTSIDLQTGPASPLGMHRFRVESLVFEGRIITAAQFYGSILIGWLLLIGSFVLYRFAHLNEVLRETERAQQAAALEAERAREAARRDHLTGALNRAGVTEAYRCLAADPRCRSVAVVLIDVDNFKLVNDNYGHAYGDEVLASLAQILKRNVRVDDIVGRWGGEEFIVICPNLDEAAILEVANKLRKRVEHFHFGDCERVTASFGAYWCDAGFSDLAPLVVCADIALYTAKARGRNRAVRYDSTLRSAA